MACWLCFGAGSMAVGTRDFARKDRRKWTCFLGRKARSMRGTKLVGKKVEKEVEFLAFASTQPERLRAIRVENRLLLLLPGQFEKKRGSSRPNSPKRYTQYGSFSLSNFAGGKKNSCFCFSLSFSSCFDLKLRPSMGPSGTLAGAASRRCNSQAELPFTPSKNLRAAFFVKRSRNTRAHAYTPRNMKRQRSHPHTCRAHNKRRELRQRMRLTLERNVYTQIVCIQCCGLCTVVHTNIHI